MPSQIIVILSNCEYKATCVAPSIVDDPPLAIITVPVPASTFLIRTILPEDTLGRVTVLSVLAVVTK